MPLLRTRIKQLWKYGGPEYFTVAVCPPPKDKLNYRGKYKLEDCPDYPGQQRDPVIRTIIDLIRQLSKEDIGVAAAGIRVWALTNAPPLWPITPASNRPVKFYAFKAYYGEFPISVPISLIQGCDNLNVDSILVRVKGRWELLRKWLLDLPDRKFLLDHGGPGVLIRTQQSWWAMNGKIFPLMELPIEVRMLVFQHIMGSKMYLDTKTVNGQEYVTRALEHQAYRVPMPSDRLLPTMRYCASAGP
jgi:hypothetical protein